MGESGSGKTLIIKSFIESLNTSMFNHILTNFTK